MSTRPPPRRQLHRLRALSQTVELIGTVRADGHQLFAEVQQLYSGELARSTDPTGTEGRIVRLIACLANTATHCWEQWAEHDPPAAQRYLAELAAAAEGITPC